MPEEDFVALCAQRPAIHRFPAAMAKRVRQVCQVLTEHYQADAANVWRDAATGAEMKQALMSLPGFGEEKAAIFTAVLGKQRECSRPVGKKRPVASVRRGSFRSVADIVDGESLARVREAKRAVKAQEGWPISRSDQSGLTSTGATRTCHHEPWISGKCVTAVVISGSSKSDLSAMASSTCSSHGLL